MIILSWSLVPLWDRVIDNFTFRTLGLDETSTYHTFVIALVLTVIFFVFIFAFNDVTAGLIESDTPVIPPLTGPTTVSSNALNALNALTITDDGDIILT